MLYEGSEPPKRVYHACDWAREQHVPNGEAEYAHTYNPTFLTIKAPLGTESVATIPFLEDEQTRQPRKAPRCSTTSRPRHTATTASLRIAASETTATSLRIAASETTATSLRIAASEATAASLRTAAGTATTTIRIAAASTRYADHIKQRP
jgi:hypothetical protein